MEVTSGFNKSFGIVVDRDESSTGGEKFRKLDYLFFFFFNFVLKERKDWDGNWRESFVKGIYFLRR